MRTIYKHYCCEFLILGVGLILRLVWFQRQSMYVVSAVRNLNCMSWCRHALIGRWKCRRIVLTVVGETLLCLITQPSENLYSSLRLPCHDHMCWPWDDTAHVIILITYPGCQLSITETCSFPPIFHCKTIIATSYEVIQYIIIIMQQLNTLSPYFNKN